MHRVTVKDARGTIARETVAVRDPSDDRDVEDAAKTACRIAGRTMPSPARVVVEESAGRRWKHIRELVV